MEVQKERNKAELQALQKAFEEEKQGALREIERLKAGDKLKIGKKKKPQRQPTQ